VGVKNHLFSWAACFGWFFGGFSRVFGDAWRKTRLKAVKTRRKSPKKPAKHARKK